MQVWSLGCSTPLKLHLKYNLSGFETKGVAYGALDKSNILKLYDVPMCHIQNGRQNSI